MESEYQDQYRPVLTKHDFVVRFQQGEFGNRLQTWDTCDEFIQYAGKKLKATEPQASLGLFHLRSRIPSSPTYYNLFWSAAVAKWSQQEDKRNWYVSQMAPTEHTVFQGEVYQSERGLDLYYSTEPKTMRDGLSSIKKPLDKQVYGTMAILFLQHYVDPPSLEWIQELLRRYPHHVIEFSTYNVCCGVIPNLRTIIWEVRGGY